MPPSDPDLVSVVIPTRNRCERVVRAISSVRDQTWPNVEIIVVDDASTDATSERLAELRRETPTLRVIRNDQPRGGGGARNIGIAATKGRWVAFLDDDDRWMPRKIEVQLATLRSKPEASAASCFFYYHGRFRRPRLVRVPSNLTEQQILSANDLGGASMCLTSRAMLDRIGGFDPLLRSGQDWELWLRLFYAGPIVVCNEPLVVYDSHPDERITTDIGSVYAGKRRIFFRYRGRMGNRARRSNIALLLYCRAMAERASARQRISSLRRIFSLGGWARGIKYSAWFTTTRLFISR